MGRTPSSVCNIYFSLGGNTHSRHGNCTFSNEEEGLVAGIAMTFSAVNLPLSNKEAHDKAEVILKCKIPKSTFNKLLARHDEEICSQTMKYLSNSQVSACTAIETANFVSSLEKLIEHY